MLSNGRLRFIESLDRYSVYERTDGGEVYVRHGFPRVFLVEYDRDWMLEQWERHTRGSYYFKRRSQGTFLDWLREHVVDPDVVDEIYFCEHCEDPDEESNGQSVGRYGDSWACDSCIEDRYKTCCDCDDLVSNYSYAHEEAICQRCLDDRYSWCDHCDEYYHHDNSSDHAHNEDCDCSSPATTFAMPNNGELLRNDDRVTVTLPAGVLDDEGLSRIRTHLRVHGLYNAAGLVEGLGREWQTREGNLTKRLSRALYKYDGSKLAPEVLSVVGSIASEHSRPVDFEVEVTRELNMDAGDFYHDGSCWWAEYSEGRCALKTNGGIGLRTFDADGDVSGRAWIMPLRSDSRGNLVATFDAEAADAFVVFNGYGNLEGYNAARIVAHMAGLTYRKIEFTCSPMYINGESAYLVAPEEIAEPYTDMALRLSVSQHSDLYHTERSRELVDA